MTIDVCSARTNNRDEWYTPEEAIHPLLGYIPIGANVWCPFDDSAVSAFPTVLSGVCGLIICTHLDNGQDFFQTEPPAGCEMIISNPPWSHKDAILVRLFDLGLPFAMLFPLTILESRRRVDLLSKNKFEVLLLNKRARYIDPLTMSKGTIGPPFASVWLTSKLLPQAICFGELK